MKHKEIPPNVAVKNRNIKKSKTLLFQQTAKQSVVYRTWFRGEHTNRNPNVGDMLDVNAATDFVVQGWAPQKPFIRPDTQITAFGS